MSQRKKIAFKAYKKNKINKQMSSESSDSESDKEEAYFMRKGKGKNGKNKGNQML